MSLHNMFNCKLYYHKVPNSPVDTDSIASYLVRGNSTCFLGADQTLKQPTLD